jgi:hypothetical protein
MVKPFACRPEDSQSNMDAALSMFESKYRFLFRELPPRYLYPSSVGYNLTNITTTYEGVVPEVMFRQLQGEALDVGDVLTWAPGYYYQKQFFSGHVYHFDQSLQRSPHDSPEDPRSGPESTATIRYDVEVSGFPSSHCGHLVLLRFSDQNYPGATTLDEWPSWNLPDGRKRRGRSSDTHTQEAVWPLTARNYPIT